MTSRAAHVTQQKAPRPGGVRGLLSLRGGSRGEQGMRVTGTMEGSPLLARGWPWPLMGCGEWPWASGLLSPLCPSLWRCFCVAQGGGGGTSHPLGRRSLFGG